MIGCMRLIFGGMLLLAAFNSFAAPPIHYIENKNQWPSNFRFAAEFPQMKVMLKDASIFFVQHSFVPDDKKSKKKRRAKAINESHVHSAGDVAFATFELKFIDALTPSISASQKQVTKYNYFSGNDPSQWASDASSYGEITYSQMYAGIDLKVYSMGNQMKYDWLVSPCADVKKIKFSYKGVERLEIRDEDLVVTNKLGEVIETKPYAYQVVSGEHRTVPAAFEIDDEVVSFVFPEGYDSNYELIIDPSLIFSSYSGSSYDNWGNTATPDSRGNLYSGGMVRPYFRNDGSFPTTPGAYQTVHNGGIWDIGILKYDSTGANVLYTTYLGGNGAETPQSLVVNSNDELLILGATSSTDFPGTSGGFKGGTSVDPLGGVDYYGGTDIFVARLSKDGSQLLASTYLGGTSNDGINFVAGDIEVPSGVESELSRNYGDQFRGDIITTPDGSVYLASNTLSSDFPIVNNTDPLAAFHGGTHDAVLAKLNPDLTIAWTRLIGGSGADAAYSIKINSDGNIVIAGGTNSTNLGGMNGLHTSIQGNIDGWIAELPTSGDQIIYGTYVGTSSNDQVYFIDIATNGDVVAYGQTKGTYPVTNGVYALRNSGQFIHKFSSDLKTTVFSTTFGKGTPSPDISPTAFLVSACDFIYVAGWGGSINAPTDTIFYSRNDYDVVYRNYQGGNTRNLFVTSDAYQKDTRGHDFYMMVLSPDAKTVVYATYFGGRNSLTHVDGGTSRFDKRGIVYHAVCASCGGFPTDFPAVNVPPSRRENLSQNCNNAAFKFDLSLLRAGLQTNNKALTKPGFNNYCLPDTIVFQNHSIGGKIFQWDFGDGQKTVTLNLNNVPHYYQQEGNYTVKLKAIDPSTCIGIDSTSTVVTVYQGHMEAAPDKDICFGTGTRLTASGGVTYQWRMVNGAPMSGNDPLVAPVDTTTYYVKMTDTRGCIQNDSLKVSVVPRIDAQFEYQKIFDCQGRPVVRVRNLTELKEGETATILFGDGTSSDETDVTHMYEADGEYIITLRTIKEFCVYEAMQSVKIVTVKVPNVITPAKEDGLNDSFKIIYGSNPSVKDAVIINLRIVNRWGNQVFEKKDYKDDWKGGDLESGVYYYEVEMDETTCKGWINLIK